MKETNITKKVFECEICHTVYDNKNAAINCEEKHKKLENIPIKMIIYDGFNYPEIRVYNCPNAQYDKETDSIKLHSESLYEGCYFMRKFTFRFDEIQYNDEDDTIKIYTTNMNEDYENECIKKIINFKIDKLNELIKKLKDKKFLTNNFYYKELK